MYISFLCKTILDASDDTVSENVVISYYRKETDCNVPGVNEVCVNRALYRDGSHHTYSCTPFEYDTEFSIYQTNCFQQDYVGSGNILGRITITE